MRHKDRHIGKAAGVARAWAAICAVAAAGAAAAQQDDAKAERLVLPSGLTATLQEVRREEDGVLRFRFLAPEFRKDVALDTIAADLEHLCNAHALPNAPEAAGGDVLIIVSLGDKPSEFGVADPGVTQVFEAYRVQDGRCIWEVF